ncbi:MAG: isochorismatase family protein [Myxococcota bacterium]
MNRYRLEKENTALLVVDVQERLCAAMEPEACERLVKRTVAAIAGAKALGLPVVVTEQYPKGLGPTVSAIKEALGGDSHPVEKVEFSCALDEVLRRFGDRKQIIVTGMETHVCVFQTARDLAERKLTPYVCRDAVLSRTAEDKEVGLELCREAGAVITSVEAALFDVLRRAGSPEFKAVSAAVK